MALLAAVIAGCSSLQNATNFQPPPGWSGTPGLFGRVQMWQSGSQTVMLIKGDARRADVFYNPQLALSGMRDVQHSKLRVCGNRTADYYRGVKSDGAIVEGISVPGSGNTRWIALYIRDEAKTPADPHAEQSLRTLCPAV